MIHTVENLHRAWRAALTAYNADPYSSTEFYAMEDATHEALVEYIESHDLNHSQWDPRDPWSYDPDRTTRNGDTRTSIQVTHDTFHARG